ncbi:MAG TPA: TRAP transporter substrate-binding protein [Burkholderiaceae bacterium]|jgi:tripartite ATP-independent transporter DctP family solute receptor|nr:TRAP transporter substrate-binding protein [Rhodoferax sp.]MBP8136070.1 TRAP transporter substrate-binding protein [Rhodoferax sp.]HNW01678.1 TRAP transporter substrate-binding protein [Burkholderiaceae bacterium]HPW07430.1 TRAP transporter substrate-binding protein [Burkholderiaceae bacterium]
MKRLVLKSIAAAVALTAIGMASAQDIKERTLKFAVAGPETHPAVPGMKKFAEAVTAKSGGKIKVTLFLNSALGGDQAVVSAIKGGTVEMSVMNSGILASEAKELALFDFPFLFANEKESDAIVDGPVGKKMHALLQEKGLVGLSYWELGYRHMTNSKRPLNKVEDIEGLKLRVIPNPINVDWVKALGANPTPLPFPEVYGALEQKAIDGQENPIAVIAANKFWEVQKYVALTNHQYNPQSVIFSKKVWDTLSPAEKKIIDDSSDEATKFQREQSRAAVAANVELLRKNGMTITQFSPAEVTKLRDKMKPVIAKYTASVGEATVNEVLAELAKMRK